MMDLLFYLNVAWIFAHELDAIQQQEWRFFNRPFNLSEKTAYHAFVVLHVPLLIWIFWAMQSATFQIGFDIFLIAHAIVHWLLSKHPDIQFNTLFSRLLIFAPVPTSIVHLIWLLSL